MSIQLVSISHKIAPLVIRELFAFTEEQQIHILKSMVEKDCAQECVVIATCNRTEVYTYDGRGRSKRDIYTKMEEIILEEAHAESCENIGDYIRFYSDTKAIHHLFQVTAGLDSMIIGEDQILGQVKKAHKLAMKEQVCGVYLNTFFRYAVTGAKKVKTETELSRTPVSTASLAVKVAEEQLGTLEGKKVMIIGASGKIGGIVQKNLQCVKGARIYVTTRNTMLYKECQKHDLKYELVEYESRYERVNEMDVIISATSSPHYTLTYDRLLKCMTKIKKRVFVDLAVPMDIEGKIGQQEHVCYFNIDDFTELAHNNNQRKLNEARAADVILEDYELQFGRWMIFQKSLPVIRETKDWMLKEADVRGVEKAIDKLFYRLRENSTPDELRVFFSHLDASFTGY